MTSEFDGLSREASDALAAALVDKAAAEAEKFRAEATKFDLDAENLRVNVRRNSLIIEQDEYKFSQWKAEDEFQHVWYFGEQVSDASVGRCMASLDLWDRLDPTCEITIYFNSPGGDVIAGMALFDHIQMLRRKGHKFTTIAEGVAASMAGILLQAGDHRIMGAETWVLIHEAAFGTSGKTFQVEDRVEWVKRVQERILDIFATRARQAGEVGTASKPMTRAQLKKNWDRKDWWLSSDDCLKGGIVDEVR